MTFATRAPIAICSLTHPLPVSGGNEVREERNGWFFACRVAASFRRALIQLPLSLELQIRFDVAINHIIRCVTPGAIKGPSSHALTFF